MNPPHSFSLAFASFFLAFTSYAGTPTSLNLKTSEEIVDRAMACGVAHHWNLSIAVVNSEGNLISFRRSDGAYLGSVDAAMGKAQSANAFERPTRVFAEGVRNGNLGLLSVKGVVANEGGEPIRISGKHVGAIGISGALATEDDICALAAIQD